MLPRHLTAVALAALCACTGTAPVTVERVVHRLPVAIDLTGPVPDRVELRLHQGHVLVVPGPELVCELAVEVPARTASEAERLARGLQLSSEQDAENTRVIAIQPSAEIALEGAHCDFKLILPGHIELYIASVRGDVTVRRSASNIRIHTEFGRIRADLRGGAAELVNLSGHTKLSGEYRSARIESDRGDVEITVPPEPHTPRAISLESDSGKLRITAGGADRLGLVFETLSGAVLSELPIRWISRDEEPGQRAVRYVGRLGRTTDQQPDLELQVRSGTGDLEVVRLRRNVADRPRSRSRDSLAQH